MTHGEAVMKQFGTTAATALVSILCLATGSAVAQGRPSGIVLPAITGSAHGADPSSILVRFEAGASPANRANARALVNGSLQRSYGLVDGLERLELHGGRDVVRAAAILRKLPFVAYAHPNYVIAADQLPERRDAVTLLGDAPPAVGRIDQKNLHATFTPVNGTVHS